MRCPRATDAIREVTPQAWDQPSVRNNAYGLTIAQLRVDPMIGAAIDYILHEEARAGHSDAARFNDGTTLVDVVRWATGAYFAAVTPELRNMRRAGRLYRLLALVGEDVAYLAKWGDINLREEMLEAVQQDMLAACACNVAKGSEP